MARENQDEINFAGGSRVSGGRLPDADRLIEEARTNRQSFEQTPAITGVDEETLRETMTPEDQMHHGVPAQDREPTTDDEAQRAAADAAKEAQRARAEKPATGRKQG